MLVPRPRYRASMPEALDCPGPRGAWTPVIDHRRCEAKGPCVTACPYDVLGIQRISAADWAELGTIAKLRSTAHRRRTAYVVTPDACRGCGLCVEVCPEQAIRLRAFPRPS